MLANLESLISIPDISKWKTPNLKEMFSMFVGCKKLFSIPNIPKWDVSKVIFINYRFSGCESLNYLSNFSNIVWSRSF